MRNLASIQRIENIEPIPGADRIVVASILGWKCVVPINKHQIGDKCVYFEVDSYLPMDSRFEFLKSSSYKNNELLGCGYRIKTQNLRGQLSQGLVMPLSEFPEIDSSIDVGSDVTELLGVRKWEVPEIIGNAGTAIGDKPWGIQTTDETRIQSIVEILDKFKNKPYYISTKIDGTSCTIAVKDGEIAVCGRNDRYKDEPNCPMWHYVHKLNLDEKLMSLGKNIIIQGEFAGPGIQKNRLKLIRHKLFIFNVIDLDTGCWYGLHQMIDFCEKIGVDTVPIEEVGECFNYTLEKLLVMAQGKYESGNKKEGIVVRLIDNIIDTGMRKPLSFKVLNNDFLLSE